MKILTDWKGGYLNYYDIATFQDILAGECHDENYVWKVLKHYEQNVPNLNNEHWSFDVQQKLQLQLKQYNVHEPQKQS